MKFQVLNIKILFDEAQLRASRRLSPSSGRWGNCVQLVGVYICERRRKRRCKVLTQRRVSSWRFVYICLLTFGSSV